MIDQAYYRCQQGCIYGYTICQPGYYCNQGVMLPCPLGTYRSPSTNFTHALLTNYASQCIECPYGTYRDTIKGKSVTDCALCPIGKYSNAIGQTSQTACLKCPAGTYSSQAGSRICECITAESCDMPVKIGNEEIHFYKTDCLSDIKIKKGCVLIIESSK